MIKHPIPQQTFHRVITLKGGSYGQNLLPDLRIEFGFTSSRTKIDCRNWNGKFNCFYFKNREVLLIPGP
ncbi:hypothetical protein RJT34_23075 [Clitoria ternatea]|uniref:Uncharacterized protein n=1 Tax=Clitoria ternatea TaxID=43366 RepID=A0AAN9FS51_CLITE